MHTHHTNIKTLVSFRPSTAPVATESVAILRSESVFRAIGRRVSLCHVRSGVSYERTFKYLCVIFPHMETKSTARNVVKSAETLFRLIDHLRANDEMGVTELATEMEMSKSAVHKHLQTLSACDYVINENGRYQLGFKFLTLGGQIRDQDPICQCARPVVEDLADRTNQNTAFVIREGCHGIFAYVSNDRYGLRETVPLGNRYPLHQNASGKAILSTLSDEEVERIVDEIELPGQTPNTITERAALFDELDTIRERGYATSEAERIEGVQSIAAAVEAPKSDRVGALSLAGPNNEQLRRKIDEEYAETVVEMANELELQLMYQH